MGPVVWGVHVAGCLCFPPLSKGSRKPNFQKIGISSRLRLVSHIPLPPRLDINNFRSPQAGIPGLVCDIAIIKSDFDRESMILDEDEDLEVEDLGEDD